MVESSERTAIQQVAQRLMQSHPDVPADTVSTVVELQYARFDGRRVRDFVPLFVERSARCELAAQRN